MTAQYILIGGMVFAFVVSGIAESMIARGSAELDGPTRERAWQRQLRGEFWWRIPQYIAMGMMAAALAKILGLLRGINVPISSYAAIGISIYCLSMCVRAWIASRAYNTEAPGSKAGRSAFTASIFVYFAEVALAAVVCGIVFVPQIQKALAGKSGGPAAPGGTTGAVGPASVPADGELLWVGRKEALKLLKSNDAAYLDGLVKIGEVTAEKRGGSTAYNRNDITQTVLSGVWNAEKVQERIQEMARESAPEPVPKPAKKERPKDPTLEALKEE